MQKEVFSGLKVLDFGWIIAGPMLVKYLSEHGAEVVHVETSRKHGDVLRSTPPFKDSKPGPDRSAYFIQYHANQYGLSVNLSYPEGIDIIKRLVAWADVVTENFAPGVMERLGLGYEELKKINPDIIMFRSSQLGQTGPRASMPGTGNQLTALSGFSHLSGWRDKEPALLYGGFTDCGAARLGAAALIAALLYRHKTGKGQCLDLSQYEAGVSFIAPLYLDYAVNGRVACREGNRCSYAAPHAIYPCKGEDRWCAISIFADEEWRKFCQVTGNPGWLENPKFSTLCDRKENEDELDRLVAAWTVDFTAEELMQKLQNAGISAGVAQNCRDLLEDPQLKHYNFYWAVEHPVLGKHRYDSQAFRLSRTPRKLRFPAPRIGEHNEHICTRILGMSDEEFVGLVSKGVLE